MFCTLRLSKPLFFNGYRNALKVSRHIDIYFPRITTSVYLKAYSSLTKSTSLATVVRCRYQTYFSTIRGIVNKQGDNQSTFKVTKKRHLVLKTILGIFGVITVCGIANIQVMKYKNRCMGIEIDEMGKFQDKSLMSLYKYKGYKILWDLLKYIHDGTIENFEVREDDVWIVTFFRSGTTLTSEMTYLIVNDLNFKKAEEELLTKRVPFFENRFFTCIEDVDRIKSPRTIKTHLPLGLLPKQIEEKKAKIIYVARNPKDVSVSMYHHLKMLPAFLFKFRRPTLEEIHEANLIGNLPMGPWWKHVREFWEIRERPNILFLKYEDIVTDTRSTVEKISSFLGKQMNEEDVQKIVEHCKFDKMKDNPKVNCQDYKDRGIFNELKFIRKGKIGDWRNSMTTETSRKFDAMVETELGGSGLTFRDS